MILGQNFIAGNRGTCTRAWRFARRHAPAALDAYLA